MRILKKKCVSPQEMNEMKKILYDLKANFMGL